MAAFKEEYSAKLVADLGAELRFSWPEFPLDRWQLLAGTGLEELELLQRVDHLASGLVACLPSRFKEAAPIVARLVD